MKTAEDRAPAPRALMDNGEEAAVVAGLRNLVGAIYRDCFGAYGAADGDGYSGQYESEIQALAAAILGATRKP